MGFTAKGYRKGTPYGLYHPVKPKIVVEALGTMDSQRRRDRLYHPEVNQKEYN